MCPGTKLGRGQANRKLGRAVQRREDRMLSRVAGGCRGFGACGRRSGGTGRPGRGTVLGEAPLCSRGSPQKGLAEEAFLPHHSQPWGKKSFSLKAEAMPTQSNSG